MAVVEQIAGGLVIGVDADFEPGIARIFWTPDVEDIRPFRQHGSLVGTREFACWQCGWGLTSAR